MGYIIDSTRLLALMLVCVLPCAVPQVDTLYAGEVGYLAAQIKSVLDARVGDTVTLAKAPAAEALEGYEDVQPMVYCGLFPTDADDYQVRIEFGAPL
jgi:GTP-binding protein LepA